MPAARSLLLGAALAVCAAACVTAQPAPGPASAPAPGPKKGFEFGFEPPFGTGVPSPGPASAPSGGVSPEALVGTWSCILVTLTAIDSLAEIKAAGGSAQLGAMGSPEWSQVLKNAINPLDDLILEIPAFEWINEKQNVGFFLTKNPPVAPGDFYENDDDSLYDDDTTYNGQVTGADTRDQVSIGTVVRSYPGNIRYDDPIDESGAVKEYLIERVDSNDNGLSRFKQLDEDTLQILYTEAGTLNEKGQPVFSSVQAPSITIFECARV